MGRVLRGCQGSPYPVGSGTPVTWTITLRNHGHLGAQAVRAVVDLPSALTAVTSGATGSDACGGSMSQATVQFDWLPAGAFETITVVGTASCGLADGAALAVTAPRQRWYT